MDLGTIVLTAFLTWLVEKFANGLFNLFLRWLGNGSFLEDDEREEDQDDE
jgi:hypothetical protein